MFNVGNEVTLRWTGDKGVRADLTNTKAKIYKINKKRMIVKTATETLNILPEQTLEYFKANNYWINKDKNKSIDPLTRIADTLDEILKLVKDDMAASKKRWENENIGE